MQSLSITPCLSGPWLKHPATQTVLGLLEEAGHSAYLVGGTIRNALMGLPVTDLDATTDATPQKVIDIFKARGIRVIPTGLEHGTVTVVVENEPVEITTFRRDVSTDGRRAVVSFSTRIEDDARRRDFTINALYADRSGRIIDPLGGLDDVYARRLRFIEDPDRRIREDYLRTLRLFRFHAKYGNNTPLDPDTLSAISRNLDGLTLLSIERVSSEIMKILSVDHVSPTLNSMQETGVLDRILPEADISRVHHLEAIETHLQITSDPLRRLACLNISRGDALRLSRRDQKYLSTLCQLEREQDSLEKIAWQKSANTARDVLALRSARSGRIPQSIPHLDAAEAAIFPLTAYDLMPHFSGPALGRELQYLKDAWIASGFTLQANDLRAMAESHSA